MVRGDTRDGRAKILDELRLDIDGAKAVRVGGEPFGDRAEPGADFADVVFRTDGGKR